MTTAAVNEVIYFTQTYRHGVDEKRRLQIPAKWRPESADFPFALIPWPNGAQQDACLLGLPPQEWINLVASLKGLPSANAQTQVLRRLIGSKSAHVTMDKAGRICLPDEMAKTAGINGEAVLVGMVDRFQIWSPDRFAMISMEDAVLAPEAFKLLS